MTQVLAVEHNTSTLTYLKADLKKSGNYVDAFDNSLEAWKALSKNDYDILLVNISMPGMDGFSLAQRALEDNPGLQVIFITGFAAVVMDTYNTPAYSPKPLTSRPFHLKDIGARVKYLMGEGDFPVQKIIEQNNKNNIVYCDFSEKNRQRTA